MITHLTAERRDHLEGTSEIFINGPAIRRDRFVSARECLPFSGTDILERNEQEVILIHRGETESRIVLPYAGSGEAEVTTMVGTLRFTSELTEFAWEEEEIRFRYRLLQDSSPVTDLELVFRFGTPEGTDLRA